MRIAINSGPVVVGDDGWVVPVVPVRDTLKRVGDGWVVETV